MRPQDVNTKAVLSFEAWKAELIRTTAKETRLQESEIKINDQEAREWYEGGFTPYVTFRETWQNENDVV